MSEDVCRMCLQQGAPTNFISITFGQPSIKTKLAAFIPEMNMGIIQDAVVCGPCSAALDNAYHLKMKCLRSEEKIWNRLHAINSANPPRRLTDLLPFNESPRKDEEMTVELSTPLYNHYPPNNNVNSYNIKPYQTLNPEPEIPSGELRGASYQNGDVFICTTCKQSFASGDELHEHIPKHLATRPFMCTYCYKCFTLKSNLHIHIRTHTQIRPYTCEYCSKSFTTKGNLKTHIRVHTKEKPYACPLCEKCFIQKVQLNTHMLLHEDQHAFSCDVCGKSYSSKASLQVHKRLHEDVKPFICEFCDIACTSNMELVYHVRIHSGPEPYACSLCNGTFSSKPAMVEHRSTHEGYEHFSPVTPDVIVEESKVIMSF